MLNELCALVASYRGVSPHFNGPPAFAGVGAAVLGRARIGCDAWLGGFSVIRADGHDIEIGDDFHLGMHGTVHIAHDLLPTHIGSRVSAGPRSVIHACDVASDCVIEREAIILDGASLGAGAVLTAGSVVFPRTALEGGWIYSGVPAKPVARTEPARREALHQQVRTASCTTKPYISRVETPSVSFFAAPTAAWTGRIVCGCEVGIWYGCQLAAGDFKIDIGNGTNIQDNVSIHCENDDVVIASDVTIGHNATLVDCRVEPDSLVGIGALISPGTIVESDTLVAAGTETKPGQRLTSGQVWAGRPARPIGHMDERKRKMLADTLPRYRAYARTFRQTMHRQLSQPREE